MNINSFESKLSVDDYEELKRKTDIYRKYSRKNCKLILEQNPNARCAATYIEWQKLNRQVKAGEQAIYIWAPNDHGWGFHKVPIFEIEQTKALCA